MKTTQQYILLSIITFFVYTYCFAQEKSNFRRLPGAQIGNSMIVEDDLGYIWIRGSEGLIKYDGYNFNLISYQAILNTPHQSDRGNQIAKDSQGNLWLSSFGGNLIKIGKDGNYTSFKDSIRSDRISSIRSINNVLWFGSTKGIMYKYDSNLEKIEKVNQLPNLNNKTQKIVSIAGYGSNTIWMSTFSGKVYAYSLNSNTLNELINPFLNVNQTIRLTTDKQGHLWIATERNGLLQYNPITKKIIKRHGEIITNNSLPKYPMFIQVICDSSGVIWASTDGDGLYKIDPRDNSVSIFKNDSKNRFSISNNTITYIYEDKSKNIWALSKKGEINILPKENTSINYFSGSDDNTPTNILSILKSEFDRSLWMGTDGNGLNRVWANNTVTNYNNSKKGGDHFAGKYIQSLLEDETGNIWIATYQNGLWVYNISTQNFLKIETENKQGNKQLDIRNLFKDSKNRIWLSVGESLHVYTSNQKKIASFDYNSRGLKGIFCHAMCEDENGSIWAGISAGGLFKFHENKDNFLESYFTEKKFYQKNDEDVSNYNVASIIPDYNGNLYINTMSGNLFQFQLENEKFGSLSKKERLKNITITSVLYEKPNKLWLSSETGIHQFHIKTDSLKSYYLTDGLQSNNFRRRSSFKDSNGNLYFGGENGANSFYPIAIVKKETQAKLYINEIEILNKPAKSIIKDQLKTRIEDVERIRLNASQSSFSFQFSVIDNLINSNFKYAYRLKGFDKDWITSRQGRIATYTNISSGHYTFEVKASSENGIWNIEPKKVIVLISPPWWLSTIAYICYFIIALLGTYGIILWIRLKKKLVIGEWENDKAKELYGLKMNFFTKMSHEIQTPLTLILGPIEDMLDRATTNKNQLLKQRLTIISNNAKRLSRIATELMTVRNKELGRLRVYASQNEIIKHLKTIVISFSEQARFKNIDFTQSYSHQKIKFWYDKDKIEHIIYNLLSNAFKFTPREGNIKLIVNFNEQKESLNISVKDSGPGIAKDELDAIFELFYQSNLGLDSKGSGIGLALTQELITLHNGDISVDSSSENGTNFTVKLSTKESNFSLKQKIVLESNDVSLENSELQNYNSLKEELEIKENVKSNKKHTLLIVEDNIEMQMFLRDTLNDLYNLIIAENGKNGVSLAEKYNPDLIISDIMMPIMDGVEMCKILQKKKSTSHIPIIFLTAKNNSDGRLSGLKAGAVEYLKKPFNFYELMLKINNIITTKEKSISKYKTDIITTPEIEVSKSRDDLFMEKLISELNNNLEDSDFKLEDLTNSLNLSYSAIYRKCHDITGKTLVELVRTLKLKKAAYLIVKQGYNVSEAAFTVGYKDPKYFTKCFKQEFGQTPNYFKKESKNSNLEVFFDKYNIENPEVPSE